jgi:hypothetical protein
MITTKPTQEPSKIKGVIKAIPAVKDAKQNPAVKSAVRKPFTKAEQLKSNKK